MPKYLSGRVKRRDQAYLSTDRYQFLGLEQAEPNLGDSPSLTGSLDIPAGQQYQIVSLIEKPGERFWVPIGGGVIPGSISVFDEGSIVGTLRSITQLNFTGNSITASDADLRETTITLKNSESFSFTKSLLVSQTSSSASGVVKFNTVSSGIVTLTNVTGTFDNIGVLKQDNVAIGQTPNGAGTVVNITGVGVTIRVAPAGNENEVLFVGSDDFSTDTRFSFVDGLLNTGDKITVGIGGTVITTTDTGKVGIGTTIPTAKLDMNVGSAFTAVNVTGTEGQLLLITDNISSGSIFAVNDVSGMPSIDVDASGTIQLAPFGENEFVGIGTTNPTSKLHVVGDTNLAGNLNVSGVSTFQDDIFVGVGATVGFGTTAYFRDNVKAVFGNDEDLVIYHSGDNSVIRDQGAGALVIQGQDVSIQDIDNNATMALFTQNGSVDLHFNGEKRVETTNEGILVSGGTTTGTLNVSGVSTFQDDIFIGVGATVGFGTTAYFRDNARAVFGDSEDLSIYHKGDHSFIDEFGTGNLRIRSNNFVLFNTDRFSVNNGTNNQNLLDATVDGGIILYQNSNEKIKTTEEGILVSGGTTTGDFKTTGVSTFTGNILPATTNSVNIGESINLQFNKIYANEFIGQINTVQENQEIGNLQVNGISTFIGLSTFASGIQVISGVTTFKDDVEFHGVSGITSVSFDKSDNSLKFVDNAKLKIGDSGDLQLYHNALNSWIVDQGTGNLVIGTNGEKIRISKGAGAESLAEFRNDSSVDLYYDDVKRFSTSGIGATVYGQLDTTDLNASGIATVGLATVVGNAGIGSLEVVGISTFRGDVSIAEKIVHTGDTNTNISFPDDDTILFKTNNYDRLRIHKNQYLVSVGSTGDIANPTNSRFRIGGRSINTGGTFATLEFMNGLYSGTGDSRAVASIRANRDTDNYGVALSFHTAAGNPNGLSDGDFERLRIGRDGRIVIQTGPLFVPNQIKHKDDEHTLIEFDEDTINFDTGGTQRLRIDSNGNAIFSGNIDANGDLDVNGRTELDITNISETLNVTGISTFNNDVTFVGASTNIFFDSSENALEFKDDAVARFGDGNDLNIFHNGSDSYIAHTGIGSLVVRANSFNLRNLLNNEDYITAKQNESVNLYYDNVKRFSTSGIGATVYGQLDTTQLIVSGVSTFTGDIDANANLEVDGQGTFHSDLVLQADNKFFRIQNNAGFNQLLIDSDNGDIATYGSLDVDGHTDLDNVNIVGVTTTLGSMVDISNSGSANLTLRNTSAIANDEGIANINIVANDGPAGYTTGAQIKFQANNSWTDTRGLTDIFFKHMKSSSPTTLVNALRISAAPTNVSTSVAIGDSSGSNSTNYYLFIKGYERSSQGASDDTVNVGILNQSQDSSATANIDFRLGQASLSNTAAVRLLAGKSSGWTNTASTRDGYFAISVANNAVIEEKMRIRSSGNVGIGTVSPLTNLHIHSGTPRITMSDSGTGAHHRINADSSVGNLAFDVDYDSVTSDPAFVVNVKGAEKARITGFGSFAVGTLNPQDIVTIRSTDNDTSFRIIDPSNDDYGAHFSFYNSENEVRIGGINNTTKRAALRINRDAASSALLIDASSNTTLGGDLLRTGSSQDIGTPSNPWNKVYAGEFIGLINTTQENVTTGNLLVTGIATFQGNVSIAGTLTYEDVTNIDSIGIITARTDVHVGAGISVVGVGSFGSVQISGGVTLTNLPSNGDTLQITSPTGYIQIGSQNANNAHFYTDRQRFYFNKRVMVDEGIIGSFNEDLAFVTDTNEERLRIENDTGNVGIGTAADDGDAKLVIEGVTALTNTDQTVMVRDSNSDDAVGRGGNIGFGAYVDGTMRTLAAIGGLKKDSGNSFNGNLALYTRRSAQSTLDQRLTILSTGEVGINDTNPSSTLTVAGDVSITRGTANSSLTRTLSIGGARNQGNNFASIDLKNYDNDSAPTVDYVAARITGTVPSTPQNGGELVFYTSPTGGDPTGITVEERLRIGSSGITSITGEDDQDNFIVDVAGTQFAVHTDATDGELSLRAQDGTGSNNSKFITFFTQESGSAAAERVRITNTGHLLLNTTSAEAFLRVRPEPTAQPATTIGSVGIATVNIADFGSSTGNDTKLLIQNVRFEDGSDWTSVRTRLQKRVDVTNFGFIDFGTGGGADGRNIQFGSGDSPFGDVYIHLNNDGKVGIGTDNPGAKLDVFGNTDGNIQAIMTRGSDSRFQLQFRNETSSNAAHTTAGKFGLFFQTNSIVGMEFLRGSGTGAGSLVFTNKDGETLRINQNGNVGISTDNPQYNLHVLGTAAATNFDSLSDRRYKTNIKVIENPIEKIKKIDGVSFNWKETNEPSLGVIADDVLEVLPEIVSGKDTKSVNYNGLIGVLIEVVKDQQKQIDELRGLIDK